MPAPMPRKRNTIIAQGRVPSHRSNAQPMATPTATATTSSKPIRKPKLSAARASLTPLSEGVPEAGRSRPRRALSSRSSRSRRGSRVSRSSIGEPPAKREKTSPRSRPPRRRNGAELTGRLRECQGAERASTYPAPLNTKVRVEAHDIPGPDDGNGKPLDTLCQLVLYEHD